MVYDCGAARRPRRWLREDHQAMQAGVARCTIRRSQLAARLIRWGILSPVFRASLVSLDHWGTVRIDRLSQYFFKPSELTLGRSCSFNFGCRKSEADLRLLAPWRSKVMRLPHCGMIFAESELEGVSALRSANFVPFAAAREAFSFDHPAP